MTHSASISRGSTWFEENNIILGLVYLWGWYIRMLHFGLASVTSIVWTSPSQTNPVITKTVLGWKSFVVNNRLKSGVHEHHLFVSFLPGDALPGLHCDHLHLLLVCDTSVVDKLFYWFEISWLTWPSKNIQFLCLEKVLSHLSSVTSVIILLHCEDILYCSSFGWMWAESL